jgi:hypothetical protein
MKQSVHRLEVEMLNSEALNLVLNHQYPHDDHDLQRKILVYLHEKPNERLLIHIQINFQKQILLV